MADSKMAISSQTRGKAVIRRKRGGMLEMFSAPPYGRLAFSHKPAERVFDQGQSAKDFGLVDLCP